MQKTIHLQGTGGGKTSSGSASVLDLRYNGTGGKVTSLGRGALLIDGLTFTDGSGSGNATPFIYDTNTVVTIRDNVFIGGGSTAQDAIILGGGCCTQITGALSGMFAGYGTEVASNEFTNLNRGVYLRASTNSVIISNNSWYGNIGTRAIEVDGNAGTITDPLSTGGAIGADYTFSLHITGNLIEMDHYTYGIVLNKVLDSTFEDNDFYDPGGNVASYFYVTNSPNNTIIGGLAAYGGSTVTGDSASVASTLILSNNNGTFSPSGSINIAAGSAYKYDNTQILMASSSNLFVGNSGNLTMSASENTVVGGGLKFDTTGSMNTAIGSTALYFNTTGSYNTASGVYSLFSNTTGSYNTSYGSLSLFNATSSFGNTAFGSQSLLSNTTGSNNVANGLESLYSNTTGSQNTANGNYSLAANTTGSNNTANGMNAISHNTSATNTVAFGYAAGQGVASYSNQGGTYLGYQSGYSAHTGSDYNTLLGYQSGYDITTGANNTILGQFTTTGSGVTSGSNNILIGNGVTAGLTQAGSNQLNIGNLIFGTGLGNNASMATGNVGIGTTTPWGKLSITGAGTGSNPDFVFADSNDNPQFVIQDNGNVGIGTTGPTQKLEVKGWGRFGLPGNDAGIEFESGYGRIYRATATGNINIEPQVNTIFTTGNVGIGTTSPDMLLSVGSNSPSGSVAHFENSTGSCYINPTTTSLSCSSDSRLKTNVVPLESADGLAAVLKLNPVTYNWKTETATTSPHIGFIAQDVQPVLPDLVSQGPDGYYTLNYAGLTPYLVKAIQEIAAISGTFKTNLIAWLGSAENGITISSQQSAISRRVNTQKLCTTRSDGTQVCVTNDQLAGSPKPIRRPKPSNIRDLIRHPAGIEFWKSRQRKFNAARHLHQWRQPRDHSRRHHLRRPRRHHHRATCRPEPQPNRRRR